MQPKHSEEWNKLPASVRKFWTWELGSSASFDRAVEYVELSAYLAERKRAKDLAKRVIELNKENSRLLNLNAQIKDANDEFDTALAELKIENDRLRNAACDAGASMQIRLLEEENRRLTAERNEAAADVKRLSGDVNELYEQMEELGKTWYDRYCKLADERNAALVHAQELASRAYTEHQNWYDHSCKLVVDERNEALAEIEKLCAQRDLCEANLNAARDELAGYEAEIGTLRGELDTALDELAAQKDAIAHFDLALDTAVAFGAEVVVLREALAVEKAITETFRLMLGCR